MSAPATKKRRGAGRIFALEQLPREILMLVLPFLTPADFVRCSSTGNTMRISLLYALTWSSPPGTATQLAKAMMTVVMHKHVAWGEERREFEWNYLTFHGRFLPPEEEKLPPRDDQTQLTPYATYIALKYMEYYVLSQAIVNRATGNAHPHITTWTYAQVIGIQDQLQLLHNIREDAGAQIPLPCWCRQRRCDTLAELDDEDMKIQPGENPSWKCAVLRLLERRFEFEQQFRVLIAAQAVPHDGTRHAPTFTAEGRRRLL
jgi:hypothetical protein